MPGALSTSSGSRVAPTAAPMPGATAASSCVPSPASEPLPVAASSPAVLATALPMPGVMSMSSGSRVVPTAAPIPGGHGRVLVLVLPLIRLGAWGSFAGFVLLGHLGGSGFVDRCVRSIRIAVQCHALLLGGGLGTILNVLLGISDPGVRFHVRGPGKRRGCLVQLGCDVACLLL